MATLAYRSRLTCCLSLTLLIVAASGCGNAKDGLKKGRLAQAKADLAFSGSSTAESARSTAKVLGDRDLADNPNVALGYPAGGDGILISRDQYVISWSPHHRTPNWVAWQLQDSDLGTVHRSNSFAVDPDLDDYLATSGDHAVGPQDYKGSCFDRGHMAPSGDRTASAAQNRVTFLMSNMMPQTAFLNRQIWEHLEAHERNLVRGTDETIFIIAGGIFASRPATIGPDHDIEVPEKNFKIILRQTLDADGRAAAGSRPKVLAAVIMPNSTSTGSDPIGDHAQACDDSHSGGGGGPFVPHDSKAHNAENSDWEDYSSTVAAIATESGLDFDFATAR